MTTKFSNSRMELQEAKKIAEERKREKMEEKIARYVLFAVSGFLYIMNFVSITREYVHIIRPVLVHLCWLIDRRCVNR